VKTLYLIRHGNTAVRKKGLPDVDRPLTHKGETRAKSMAKQLHKEKVKPELIISSPAERAVATAQIFAKELAYPIEDIQNRDLLYNSITPYGFINILRSIDDKIETVLLIGHNPTLSKFAAMLLPHFWHYLPKCGVVGIVFHKETWQKISRHTGNLVLYDYPAYMDKMVNTVRKELERKVADQIHTIFRELDEDAAKEMYLRVDMASKILVRHFVKIAKGYKEYVLKMHAEETEQKDAKKGIRQ